MHYPGEDKRMSVSFSISETRKTATVRVRYAGKSYARKWAIDKIGGGFVGSGDQFEDIFEREFHAIFEGAECTALDMLRLAT